MNIQYHYKNLTHILFGQPARYLLLSAFLLLNASILPAQTGYIYVHLKSINEENSTDFSFALTNSLGTTINSFSLNDQATANNVALSGVNLNVYDMGLSHGTGGDGQLWVVAGTTFNAPGTFTASTVYYRNPQSSKWNVTTVTNAARLDGAYANQFVYVNSSHNVIFYNSGTLTTIYTVGDAYDVTANGGRIAISTNTAIKLYSASYSAGANISNSGTWSTVTTPGYQSRLDMNLPGDTIVYQNISRINSVSTVTTAGVVTSLGAVGNGMAGSVDVAYDDNGVIYANANNTTFTDLIYHYSGGVWTAETQSRTLSTLTGGASHLVYSTDVAGGTTVESIYSRQLDASGNVYWIDDERVKNSNTLNGNGIIIPVSPGTYTLTETLPSSSYDLGRYNIYDPGGATTGNVGTQVVTFVVTAGEVVFTEYVNENLNPYSVTINKCDSPYYVQTFDASNSSPNYVSPTYGTTTTGVNSFGTPFSGTAYHYFNVSSPEDGYYYLVNQESGSDWFATTAPLNDHTGNKGFFLLVNASYTLDEFYRQRLTNLVVGADYTVTYWAANVNPPPALIYPNIKIGIQDNMGNIVASASTGNIAATTWTQYSLTFTATTTTADLFLSNNNVGGYGNDLAIDDIQIQLLTIPTATGLESCTAGSGTITISSPTGSQYQYSDNGGTTYQSSPTFSSLPASTYTIAAKYIGTGAGCVSTTPIQIIPTSSIYGVDQTGLVYGVGTTGTLTTAFNATNTPTASTTAEAIGYVPGTGIFYYFLTNTYGYTFNSYNPTITTAAAYTTLASPAGASGRKIYMGGTSADGTAYYAIDSHGYLQYYNISSNTWTQITTTINDNQPVVANLSSIMNSGENYGDLTEDAFGDLWILMGSPTQYGLYEVLNSYTTAQPSIVATQIIKYNTAYPSGISGHWSGMAFDNAGNLFMTSSGGQLWEIPNGSTTPVKISNISTTMTDLAQCSYTSTPLPLKWGAFEAVLQNGKVDLDWSISQASSLRGFYVERSTDSKNWDTLGFVTATNAILDYSFMDASPAVGNNYYRIEETDDNHSSNFSNIRIISLSGPSGISIWPNPATDVLHVQYTGNATSLTALLYDDLGRTVQQAALYPGGNSINIGRLQPGIYIITVKSNNQEVYYQKVIKRSN